MAGVVRDYSGSIFLSIALHGLIAGAFLVMTQISIRHMPSASQPLSVNAVVVDSRVIQAAAASVERQRNLKVEQAAAARAAAEARVEEEKQAAAVAEARVEESKRVADTKRASDKSRSMAEARAEQERHAVAEKRAAAEQRAADEKQAADEKRATDQKRAADSKLANDQRMKAERESELKRQMAEEEHVRAVESSPLRDRYEASLRNRITSAWIKPSSARVGIDCLVEVTQVPGGQVTNARVTQCNGDAAVRQSIENAVYRASPLPDPPDPALFQRNFAFRFIPNE
jgi:colicin import membrane protein